MDKGTNKDLQNTTQKRKDRQTRTPTKNCGKLVTIKQISNLVSYTKFLLHIQ